MILHHLQIPGEVKIWNFVYTHIYIEYDVYDLQIL